MTDPISVLKQEPFNLIQRLATEIEDFYLLGSLLLALDWFSKLGANSIFNFDLILYGINTGRILVFLVLFSFTMVFAPLLLEFIRFLLVWVLPSVLNFGTDYDGIPDKRVRIYQLRRLALSENSAFLLDYVDKKEQAIISANTNLKKTARLAFCFLVNIVISLSIGYQTHATILWKVCDAFNPSSASRVFIVSIGVLLLVSVVRHCNGIAGQYHP